MVRFVGSSISTMASRNWFQVHRNIRIPSEASAGTGERQLDVPERLASGRHRRCDDGLGQVLGHRMKWVRIQNTANGMFRPISGRISPS